MGTTWDEMDHEERLAAVEEAVMRGESALTFARLMGTKSALITLFARGHDIHFRPRIAIANAKISIAPPEELGRSTEGCAWPVREPCGSDIGFCGAETLPRKPYCKDHMPSGEKRKDKATEASASI